MMGLAKVICVMGKTFAYIAATVSNSWGHTQHMRYQHGNQDPRTLNDQR